MNDGKERTTVANMLCRCGGNANFQIRDVAHFIRSVKIIVKDVPHYCCLACHTVSYDEEVHLITLLRNAYMDGLKEVQYKVAASG